MRLPRALNPDENPAQFGIFFSANRLNGAHFLLGGGQIAIRLFVFLACRSGRGGRRVPLGIAIDIATRYRKSRTGSIAIANRDIDSDPVPYGNGRMKRPGSNTRQC